MSTHRRIDRICVIVMVLSLIMTSLFMNGERLGMERVSDTDAEGYVGIMINAIRQNKWETDERLDELDKSNAQEVGTVTLTNSAEYPFNNSIVSVALQATRENMNYIVEIISVTPTGGPAGTIEVTDRQTNGFKLAFTGSASSAVVEYIVIGGIIS
jgi:hypothetical protein